MRSAIAFASLTLAVSAQTYFPPGVLAGTPEASQVTANQYSKFLRSLHEPSLWELAQQDPKAEAYRILWLREFDRPASIRFVVKPGGTGWFYRRMTTGKGGTQPGRIVDPESRGPGNPGQRHFWAPSTARISGICPRSRTAMGI